MTGLTREIGAFAARAATLELPDEARRAALMGIADLVACTVAGADEEAPRLVLETLSPPDDPAGAPLLPSGRLVPAPQAAFVNAVAGHVLDYDDVGLNGHPSVVMAPAILAEGWTIGASGRNAVAAYVAGYETWALLAELEPGQMHDRGFHPSAVQGAVATAVAVASLKGLDEERATMAVAIAASLAAGLVANFGTMTKSLHAGRAAEAGILAARLAAAGYTASPDALEHETGFLRAVSASGTPDIAERDHGLGTRWRLPESGVHVKRYPVCYSCHRAIDGMLDLVEEHDLKPEDVKEIRVGAGSTQLLMLRNHAPVTGLEAKFSMEFAMASALVARKVGLAELTDAFVRRPEVVAAMKKVRTEAIHDGIVGLPTSKPDTVEVELVSGTVLTHAPILHAKGSWQAPIGPDELKAKFLDCTDGRMPRDRALALVGALAGLEALPSLRDLPLVPERPALSLRSA